MTGLQWVDHSVVETATVLSLEPGWICAVWLMIDAQLFLSLRMLQRWNCEGENRVRFYTLGPHDSLCMVDRFKPNAPASLCISTFCDGWTNKSTIWWSMLWNYWWKLSPPTLFFLFFSLPLSLSKAVEKTIICWNSLVWVLHVPSRSSCSKLVPCWHRVPLLSTTASSSFLCGDIMSC